MPNLATRWRHADERERLLSPYGMLVMLILSYIYSYWCSDIEENRIRTHVTEIQLMQRKVPVILGNNFWMTETFWFSSNVVDWQRDDLVDLLIKWSIDWLVDWLILSVSYFVLSNIEPSRTIHISAWNKLWNPSLYIPLCIYAQPCRINC